MAKITPPTTPPTTRPTAPPAAPAASAAGSAAPGTADAAGKKEKKKKGKRVLYPALWDAKDEKRLKLAEIPADFDAKVHKPLGRKDFEDETLWYELRARALEAKAAAMRKLGAEAKAAGGTTEAQKAKKFVAMQSKIDELLATLKAAGMSDEQIAALQAQAKEKAAEKAKEKAEAAAEKAKVEEPAK